MSARFKADVTFTVTGRGLVLGGEVLEGIVHVGMKVRIPSWPYELKISSVEFIRRIDKQPGHIGLLFASRDEDDYVRWRTLDLKGQVVEIQDDGD